MTIQSEQPLAFLFPGLTVLNLQPQAGTISITAQASRSTAPCPDCAIASERIHSYYTRRPRDLPLVGLSLHLLLHGYCQLEDQAEALVRIYGILG